MEGIISKKIVDDRMNEMADHIVNDSYWMDEFEKAKSGRLAAGDSIAQNIVSEPDKSLYYAAPGEDRIQDIIASKVISSVAKERIPGNTGVEGIKDDIKVPEKGNSGVEGLKSQIGKTRRRNKLHQEDDSAYEESSLGRHTLEDSMSEREAERYLQNHPDSDYSKSELVKPGGAESTSPQGKSDLANKEIEELSKEWEKDGVESFARANRHGFIVLSQIVIPKELRGRGLGTQKIKQLQSLAQKHGMSIALSPSTDFGASSKSRLVNFYKSLGFKENKGRNKDFRISESMIWTPGK